MSNDTTADLRGELWTGNPASGGNLVLMPFSIMNVKDRLPQSLFADAAEALGKIFIYGNNGTLQAIHTPDERSIHFTENSKKSTTTLMNLI